ncbi:MarR family transcriptional regulator [Dactylosporangium sp. CS-047395]|uniref:MarR family transcriptional regulator n=1 Tax=Dactylosporangium sp. CS-047395 TaxID=3239936 RepID=UPI003D946470
MQNEEAVLKAIESAMVTIRRRQTRRALARSSPYVDPALFDVVDAVEAGTTAPEPRPDAPAAKTDPARTDADTPRTDAARTDAARTDAARTDAARTDAARTDAGTAQTNVGTSRTDAAAAGTHAARTDAPRGRAVEADTHAAEARRDAIDARADAIEARADAARGGETEARGSVTVTDIAAALDVAQPRASKLVAAAVEAGLIRREADQRDGRKALLALTVSGRELCERVHEGRRQRFAEATRNWDPAERATFAQLLTRFVDGLTETAAERH